MPIVFLHVSGSKHSRYSPPVLTVKRLFKAKNTGLTPIHISGFEIEGQPCEGFGFKVLNCEPFVIEPSQSVDVDIAFTPDFTLSKVTRTLTLYTSLSPDKRKLNFTLQAAIPGHMLFVCASVLPRPSWEPYLFYIINIFMVFILICVLITADMEAERIFKITVGTPAQRPTHLLDLRRVAEEVDHDLRHRLTNGEGAAHDEDELKSQSPIPLIPVPMAPKPMEKKLLLSRLATRSVSLFLMPFKMAFTLIWTSASIVKNSILSFRFLRSKVASASQEDDDVDDMDDEIEEDEDDDVLDEDEAIDDGDDEGEEELAAETRSNSVEIKPPNVISVSSASSSSQCRQQQRSSRKRGRQNHPNWRQKSGVESLAGSDDPCDSSSTCTESSVVEEELTSGPNRKGGSQRNKKLTNQQRQQQGLVKDNVSISTAAASNANTNKTNTSNNNSTVTNNINHSKKEKANRKLVANATPQPIVVKPTADETAVKLANPVAKSNPVEPIKKPIVAATAAVSKPIAKTAATPVVAVSTNNAITPTQQQQSQVSSANAKKTLVKQQAKVKPNEKPPRLVLKSHSESEDKMAENSGSVSVTPGTPGLVINGGSIFGPNSSSSTAPLADPSKQKTKVTPVGKILPEIKKPENLGAQFGPIGAKPATLAAASARKSTWSDSPAEPRPVGTGNNSNNGGTGSGLGRSDSGFFQNSVSSDSLPPAPIPTPADLDFGLRYQQQQQQRLLNIDEIGGGLGLTGGLAETGNSRICRPASAANNGSPTHSTLMQTLQYERRQRTEEFFSQQHQPEWPGFGSQLPTTTPESFLENLWDPPQTESSVPLASGRSGLTSTWGNFNQIWPSSLWGTSVGFGSSLPASNSTPIEPLPTYNSRLSSLQQDPAGNNSLASVWGDSPKRKPNQQQQQQAPAFQQPQTGLNASWSSTLFSNHPHQE